MGHNGTHIPLTDLYDRHVGDKAIVAALGPSLRPQLDNIREKWKGVLISCNEMDRMAHMEPTYWVFSSSVDTIERLSDRMNQLPRTHIVFASSCDPTPLEIVPELINNRYTDYDQRNWTQGDTIQLHLKAFSGHDEYYSAGHSVVLHMIAIAILIGCKEIYITGMDLDYSLGYVSPEHWPESNMPLPQAEIVEDVRILLDTAAKAGATLYVIPPNPTFGILEEKDPFCEH